jgi:uncharacterized membrane protein YeaQ/YmgE (transglycosylase-associated protein family)
MTLEELYGLLGNIRDLAGPVIVTAAITSTAVFTLMRFLSVRVDRSLVAVPVAFAILGGIAGAIAGSTTESLVGGLVTGALGIVSALLSYFLARENDPAVKAVVPSLIILLLLNSLVGLAIGQQWRQKWDEYRKEVRDVEKEHDEIWIPVTKSLREKIIDRCLAENKTVKDAARYCRYELLFPEA